MALEVNGKSIETDENGNLVNPNDWDEDVARALAAGPRFILLDEPFASLDLDGVRQVLRQIVKLQNEGRTLVVTTHDLDKIMAHADRLVLLSGGRVVRDGHPRAVLPEVERFGVRQPDAVRLGGDFRSWLN
mgnify:CR=1 FL=1